MVASPAIGSEGGQRYDIARAIRTFLGQMAAEPGFGCGAAVIKELIQNADDAAASELCVVLDERSVPPEFPVEYHSLVGPALLVWNDQPFRTGTGPDDNDFLAICDVAGGHKLQRATAAGRFGIGFNSVYFLTDSPIIFSRREVHVFDLLHTMFKENGWKFPLEDFPARASIAGPIKQVLDRALPKSVLRAASFGEIAQNGTDYQNAVFRLPLRIRPAEGERLADETFPTIESRQSLLRDICIQAAQSLLFLKSVEKITIATLTDKEPELIATVSVTANPIEFEQFRAAIDQEAITYAPGKALNCGFYERRIVIESHRTDIPSASWSFFIKHAAYFDNEKLCELRKHLHRNGERAIPWVSIAIPGDLVSLRHEGEGNPSWRVFLPLGEEGPCGCILNAHLFVGPSRQRAEFRMGDSSDDEGLRKTAWNKALVDAALVPLLADASDEMLRIIPQFVEDHPREYLSLLPRTRKRAMSPESLSAYVEQQFGLSVRILKLYDLWKDPLELLLGEVGNIIRLEMISERIAEYRAWFRHLQTADRKFITFSLGRALREYLSEVDAVKLSQDLSSDVAKEVLTAETTPSPKDLSLLLKTMQAEGLTKSTLQDLWCFQRSENEQLIKFDSDTLYLMGANPTHERLLGLLKRIGIHFGKTEWVREDVGVCVLSESERSEVDNVLVGNDSAFLALLRRTENANHHDVIQNSEETKPLIDFLCNQSRERLGEDLRLAFLVRTAATKLQRRGVGTIFLKPQNLSVEEEALWEGLLRRTFPEVDPHFADGLRRLLEHAPELLRSLDAADCRAEILTRNRVFDALHRALLSSSEAGLEFANELNRPGDDRSRCRKEAYDAAFFILEDIDNRWDQLSEEERVSALSLPIHRLADGQVISLLNEEHSTYESLKQFFFLQSEDDLTDAPLTLEERPLLHGVNSTIRRFYRTRLGISERGRVEVLKEALRQIGSDVSLAEQLLLYVSKYYQDTIDRLEESGVGNETVIEELKLLFRNARLVPCIDGEWRKANETVQMSGVAALLKRQRWQAAELRKVLVDLAYPRIPFTLDAQLLRLLFQLDSPEIIHTDELWRLAITSEADSFSLSQRARVFLRNKPADSVSYPPRANVLEPVLCTALWGLVALNELELLEVPKSMLGVSVRGKLFPRAAKIDDISRQLGIERLEVSTFLKALNVPVRTLADLDAALVEHFDSLWPVLANSDRFEVLGYVGSKEVLTKKLESIAVTLDVVALEESEWTTPDSVFSPEWSRTQPPVSPKQCPQLADLSPYVVDLWNKWCRINTLAKVVESVVNHIQTVPVEARTKTWNQMVDWLKRVTNKVGAKETAEALRGHAWLLAKKGSEEKFQRAEDTLSHSGAEILSHQFWVSYGETPSALKEHIEFKTLQADSETIIAIANCLAESVNSLPRASLQVYGEVARLLDQQDGLADTWDRISEDLPVYRLFRDTEFLVSGTNLFLGDKANSKDFGQLLWCFSNQELDEFRQAVRRVYKRLRLQIRPSSKQLLSALSGVCGQDKGFKDVHRDLVEALADLGPISEEIHSDLLNTAGVLSCAGTYEPLGTCYRDEELKSPELIDDSSRSFVMDGRDRSTSKLLNWMADRPGLIRELRDSSHRVLLNKPPALEVSDEATRVVQPWRGWLAQLANGDTALHAEVSEMSSWHLPARQLELVTVEELNIRYDLRDGGVVLPSNKWTGPQVCHDSNNTIFIQTRALNDITPSALDKLDAIVTDEIFDLLKYLGSSEPDGLLEGAFKDLVKRTLERPSVVLRRMKVEKEDHFFHQYLDQAADPEFADCFDEFQQLNERSPKRKELSEKLWSIIADKFVGARRDQIRGYGYDEFSVFAELVQNAEDAYAQRLVLEMDPPEQSSLTFKYSTANSERVLTVEHFGRPFNYWIHGARSEQAYKRDVEGVLKSAGSFKPHVKIEDQNANTVGRFGLGFKSVYLITAQPTIYSGDWHFIIKSGCIPEEVSVPEDLPMGMTRFVLPLLDEAQEEEDRGRNVQGERFVNLVPFLRQIDCLNLKRSDGTSLDIHAHVRALAGKDDGETVIEQVQVSGPTHVRDRIVNFIRLRSRNSDAQLALYLGEDGLPAPWKEAFLCDAFAVLPLRVELGCGVAVSHMFQVQSGRTHLIDPEANREKVAEVSALIRVVPQVMNALLDDQFSSFDFLRRFWSMWRWDRGDNEATDLRRGIANELVMLAERALVVPTLNRDEIVALDGRPLFCFEGVPEEFGRELLDAGAEVSISGRSIILRDTHVVPEWFLSTYDRTCKAARHRSLHPPQRIGWEDVGRLCLNRPLLAEKPDLVSVMVRTLGEAEILQVVEWLPGCLLLKADGGREVVSKLLPWSFSGVDLLPTRLMSRLDKRYDEDAVGLLKRAGLRSRPSVDDLETWIDSELRAAECIGLIQYLSDQGRWRRDFYRVAPKLQQSWFATGTGKVTSAEAFERGLITLDLVSDPLFRAWLGIRIGEEATQEPEPPLGPPSMNSRAVLEAIYRWWSTDREALTREYENQVYLDGTPPRIRQDFLPSNGRDRENWLMLLILGVTHTMGRTRPEQHREFLRRCKDQGWLDVFADETIHAEKWMGILEGYLEAQINEAVFFEWVKQFVSIFQLANWLQDYAEAFLAIDQLGSPFSLDSVTRSGASEIWQGGGPDAPSLTRTLGMGACFVVRELVRLNVLRSEHAYPHCYVPVRRVREIFARLGCPGILDLPSYRTSEQIFHFVVDTFGDGDLRKASFDHSFDIPFLLIADHLDLQLEFFDTELSTTDEEESNP